MIAILLYLYSEKCSDFGMYLSLHDVHFQHHPGTRRVPFSDMRRYELAEVEFTASCCLLVIGSWPPIMYSTLQPRYPTPFIHSFDNLLCFLDRITLFLLPNSPSPHQYRFCLLKTHLHLHDLFLCSYHLRR